MSRQWSTPSSLGRSRHSVLGTLALLAALLAGARLVTLPTPQPTPAAGGASTSASVSLTQRWPEATIRSRPAQLSDGTEFTPMLYLTAQVSVGTAPTPDGAATRVLLRDDATLTPLRQVPTDQYPQFGGFSASGDDLVWAESLSPDDGPVRTRIWRVNWRAPQTPELVTADTGDVIFFQSQYDVTLEDGRVTWVAAATTDFAATEVRSVALAGGEVRIRRFDGAYALSSWPWIVSASSGQSTPVQLVNLDTGARVEVATSSTEAAVCGPAWCRMAVLGGASGVARLDLVRPDGSDRRRVAGAAMSSVIPDVLLSDRFVPLAADAPDDSPLGSSALYLYDLTTEQTTLIADAVATVAGHGSALWWSSWEEETLTWSVLDLGVLS